MMIEKVMIIRTKIGHGIINLFLKLRNIIVGNWRNLTGYTSDEIKRRR